MFDIVTVTVNYKSKEKIVAMLVSLFRDIEGGALKVQPVIVDNDYGDSIEETLKKEFGDRVVFIDAGGNIGFGKGNNLGFKKFEAKYYFIANPDLIFLKEIG